MKTPELDAGGTTPELKLRLKFYCSWSFLFVCSFLPDDFFGYLLLVLLVLLLWIFFFLFLFLLSFISLSMLSTLPSSSSHPYSIPLHFPSFSYAKYITPLSNNSFCPSHPLSSPSPHLPLPFSPNLSPDYPLSFTPITH
jgi:hypothetical protein